MSRFALFCLIGGLFGFGVASCAPNGCATNADCARGETCAAGACAGKAVNGGAGGGSGNAGGGGQSAGETGQCAETFSSAEAKANLMIVLDHSTSMNDYVGNTSKWSAAVSAVTQMTKPTPNIQFGLEMFSMPDRECSAGSIVVPIGPDTGKAIVQKLPPYFANGSGTQIAGGLTVAATDPALADATRVNGVVLITDGMQNCLGSVYAPDDGGVDDPRAVVKALFARQVSVRTWVVGFGGDVDADMLNAMAVNGGTARLTQPRYYQAEAPADLVTALRAITNAAQGCSVVLSKVPGDITQLYVGINQQIVQRDPTHVTGWDYDSATNRVTLYGPACDALANTAGARLSVQYGCPDGMIETGGDGGFNFEVDAGDFEIG